MGGDNDDGDGYGEEMEVRFENSLSIDWSKYMKRVVVLLYFLYFHSFSNMFQMEKIQ